MDAHTEELICNCDSPKCLDTEMWRLINVFCVCLPSLAFLFSLPQGKTALFSVQKLGTKGLNHRLACWHTPKQAFSQLCLCLHYPCHLTLAAFSGVVMVAGSSLHSKLFLKCFCTGTKRDIGCRMATNCRLRNCATWDRAAKYIVGQAVKPAKLFWLMRHECPQAFSSAAGKALLTWACTFFIASHRQWGARLSSSVCVMLNGSYPTATEIRHVCASFGGGHMTMARDIYGLLGAREM